MFPDNLFEDAEIFPGLFCIAHVQVILAHVLVHVTEHGVVSRVFVQLYSLLQVAEGLCGVFASLFYNIEIVEGNDRSLQFLNRVFPGFILFEIVYCIFIGQIVVFSGSK
ncbi:hypothetical protein D9M68_807760 [compost metagenome]